MTSYDHTMSPGCWCAPVVLHVPPQGSGEPAMVDTVRDAERLAQLGVVNVAVRGEEGSVGGENGDK